MPESEVALRLALYLLELPCAEPTANVYLDTQHIESHGRKGFPVVEFLAGEGWTRLSGEGERSWQGSYVRNGKQIILATNSRRGDVVATIANKTVRAECKKGRLSKTKGNPQNKLVHEAIGQLLTTENITDDDVLLVAIPKCTHNQNRVEWGSRPLMKRIGIKIVLVGRDGTVDGLSDL